MIDSKSLKNSTGMADILDQKGIRLAPIEASPLHHILATTDVDAILACDTVDVALTRIDEATRNEDHDGTMHELADLAAQSILNTQMTLKKTVLPHIVKVLGMVEEATKESKQAGLPYTVEYRDIPHVLTLDATSRLIEQFAKGDLFETDQEISVGDYDLDSLLEKATYTNDGGFNDMLKTHLVKDETAVNVISSVLAGKSYLSNVKDPVTLLAILVIAVNMSNREEDIPSGLNIPLSAYKYRLLWLSISASKTILAILNRHNSDITNRILYTGAMRQDNVIEVNKAVFSNLVNNSGLTVESLIGNEILGRPFSGHSLTVAENIEATKAKYDSELSMASRRNEIENDITYTQSIYKMVMEDARERSKDEECLALLNDTPETLVMRAKVACERLYKAGVTGKVRDHLVASLICSIYYAHTDALMFLSIMGDVSKQNSELSPEAIALVARTEFAAWYVFKQLAIVKSE